MALTVGHMDDRSAIARRARLVLLKHLTPEQRMDFGYTRSFIVTSQFGNRYRITVGSLVYDANDYAYCLATAAVLIPAEDQALIKKLLLETDEARFLRVAVRSQYPLHP